MGEDGDRNVHGEAPTMAAGKAGGEQQQQLPTAVEFEPPLACVRRILKNCLPGSTNVGKDASAAFARASGIFIIYLTACANDFARESKRQTITANDVLAAIKELDFDDFTPDMIKFLENYRAAEKSKKDAKASKQKAATALAVVASGTPAVAASTTPTAGKGAAARDDSPESPPSAHSKGTEAEEEDDEEEDDEDEQDDEEMATEEADDDEAAEHKRPGDLMDELENDAKRAKTAED